MIQCGQVLTKETCSLNNNGNACSVSTHQTKNNFVHLKQIGRKVIVATSEKVLFKIPNVKYWKLLGYGSMAEFKAG